MSALVALWGEGIREWCPACLAVASFVTFAPVAVVVAAIADWRAR